MNCTKVEDLVANLETYHKLSMIHRFRQNTTFNSLCGLSNFVPGVVLPNIEVIVGTHVMRRDGSSWNIIEHNLI
jgi:hypothetical protein